jgi:hypothetical protein
MRDDEVTRMSQRFPPSAAARTPCLSPLARALLAGVLAAPAAAAAFALSAADASPFGGGTIVVMNCDDDGTGSLREAVRDLAVSGDTIDLRFLPCSTITLTTGAIATNLDDLRLVGDGPYHPTIRAANQASSVLMHGGAGTLALEGLTLQDGRKYAPAATARGGCLFSQGDVVLSNVIVRACTAEGDSAAGGGVYAGGDLTLFESAIGANLVRAGSGAARGGGAAVGGMLDAKYSAFVSNTAEAAPGPGWGECGGVVAANANFAGASLFNNYADYFAGACSSDANAATPLLMRNSTVSNNRTTGSAPSEGGTALHVANRLTLRNSTIAHNFQLAPGPCGGIFVRVAAEIESSLIAANASGTGTTIASSDLCGGPGATVGGSRNLIRASSLALPSDTLDADPRIGSLTPIHLSGRRYSRWVHPLLPDSPALDAGSNPLGLDYDQRGAPYARTIGAATDIGAYELDPDRLFVDGFD